VVGLRYVERDPVRAQLVTRPEDDVWSRAAAHVGLGARPALLDWEFYASSGGQQTMGCTISEPEQPVVIRALQPGTFSGRPVGSPEFVANLERQLGRPLAPRQGQRTHPASVVAVAP
jgi:putative transposase